MFESPKRHQFPIRRKRDGWRKANTRHSYANAGTSARVDMRHMAAATRADISGCQLQHRDCRAIEKDCVVRRLAVDYAALRKISSFDFVDYLTI